MPEAAIPLPVLDDAELASGLLDIAPSLFGAASLDGRFVRLSRAWEDTLGFPIETLEGSSFLDLVHPEDRDATLDALSRLGDSERLSGFKNRYRTASGDYVWIEWRSRRGLDGLIYFAANDITETVRLRARLEESHQRLDQAAELAGVGGWELRLEDDHLRWDQRTRRIHEVPDDFEPDLDTAISFYSPEARKTIRTAVEGGIETGEPWSITLPLITAKKRRIWVRATGRAIPGPDGAPAKLAGTFQDVTEDVDRAEALEAARAALKESEARLQSATEAADVGVWTFRPLEDRIYFSAKCLSILGKGHEEIEMDGAEYASHIHPDDRERVIKAIFEHMAGRADSYIIEARYLHADGRALWTQSFGRVVERDAKGRAVAMCGTFQDISERKAQERLLDESRKAAEAANEAKSRFLANMSHEIRTPLNGVMGMAQLLARSDLDERQQYYLSTLEQSGRALLAIIEDVLDISRIEAGRLALEPAPLDLSDVLHAAQSTVAAQAAHKGLRLETHLDPELERWRLGDEKRIRQVLINLAGNAVKFTEQGSVRIRIAEGARPGRVRFEVTDTGPGVCESQRETIFDRFAQADDSAARAHGGSGLGLAISKELVELAGGEIGLDPPSGEGATFWFEWPMPGADGAADAEAVQGDGDPVAAPDDARRLILVVEDHPVNRALIEEHLASCGFDTVSAADGAQALQRLDAGTEPDAILMDIQMPVMTGDAAIRRIRARPEPVSRAPIFALTADAATQTRDRMRALGADAVFVKPLNLKSVTAALRRAVHADAEQEAQSG